MDTSSSNCWQCGHELSGKYRFCGDCGSVISFEEYNVVASIGGGNQGKVFKCYDTLLDRYVAVKQLDNSVFDEDARKRFQNELQTQARLSSENIVHIYKAGPITEAPYFVMEFVDGKTLEELLADDIDKVRSRFPSMIDDICEGIRVAHSNDIIHRDIKPANILIAGDGTAKIADFGVAKFVPPSSLVTSMLGSPFYMAPEIWRNDGYGKKVDIWALGVLCYYIWTGKLPFEAHNRTALGIKVCQGQYDPPAQVNPAIPVEVATLIERMLLPEESRANSVATLQNQFRSLQPNEDPPPASRRLNDFQKQIDAIYGFKNDKRPSIILLSHLSTNVAGIISGLEVLPIEYGKERVRKYLPKSFAWLCALVSSANCTIEELIWLKFADRCIYCKDKICSCPDKLDKTEADINEQLLADIRENLIDTLRSESFAFYAAMFERIYGARNRTAGIDRVCLRLSLEIQEAADALLKIDSLKMIDSLDVMQLEMADIVAWFFALLGILTSDPNTLGEDYDFEVEFFSMFNDKCYRCGARKCRCPEATKEIELINWK
ncbi:MAG: protein kinase [Pyrinomonadaceae bacterium]|nr:protein kinase [Pyrinomonadaceae bacterium]